MSPRKYQDSEVTKVGLIMNGHLCINKESHMIQKPSSCPNENPGATRPTKRQPVIIYTQPPKVIHAEPHEFMALVQKLTGMPNPNDENPMKSEVKEDQGNSFSKDCGVKNNLVGYGENEASSSSMNEGFVAQMKESNCSYLNNMDATMFMPNSNDLFYSSRPNSFSQSSSTNAISPSILDYYG